MFKKMIIVIIAMFAVNAYAGDKPSQKEINTLCMAVADVSGLIAEGRDKGLTIQQAMQKINTVPEGILEFMTIMTTEIYTRNTGTVKQWQTIGFTSCVNFLNQ